MHSKLFEAPLGVSDPWFVNGVDFDAAVPALVMSQAGEMTIVNGRGGSASAQNVLDEIDAVGGEAMANGTSVTDFEAGEQMVAGTVARGAVSTCSSKNQHPMRP